MWLYREHSSCRCLCYIVLVILRFMIDNLSFCVYIIHTLHEQSPLHSVHSLRLSEKNEQRSSFMHLPSHQIKLWIALIVWYKQASVVKMQGNLSSSWLSSKFWNRKISRSTYFLMPDTDDSMYYVIVLRHNN